MSGSSEPGDANAELPQRGRLLGLDYGTRRIGIAVSDDEQHIASPLENYTRSRDEVDAARLKSLAEEYRVVGLVVGLPIHTGGEEGQKAREARRFAAGPHPRPRCPWPCGTNASRPRSPKIICWRPT